MACGLVVVLVATGIAVSVAIHRAEPMLRALIVEKLSEHFHARVELDSFHVSLVEGVTAEGKGLRIWPPAQVAGVAVPETNGAAAADSEAPLIRLAEFRFHAPLHYTPGKPIRISVVQLKGLEVDIPPKTHFAHAALEKRQSGSQGGASSALVHFAVSNIECKDAHLTLETDKPGKLPLEFSIAQIKLTGVNAGGSMHFDAELTNPRPPGVIHSSGSLGPWAVDDPGETPVAGTYRFDHADLGVFKGIAGILSSTGKYEGVLRDLVVDGETDTPDFRLTHFGTALPLHTVFHAHVDGTNGDTWLQPVVATLGQSHFTAVGKIVRQKAETLKNGRTLPGGHEIALTVNVDHGRMEDFLRLASHSGTPLLTGDLTLKTSLEIPPGTDPVVERLKLNGSFALDNAEFTSEKIQDSIGQLSLRGQGDAKEAKHGGNADVLSAMQGDFTMASETVTLSDLKYTVPGAEIDLKGTYGVDGGVLNFAGTARTEAKVSQLVGGWKGLLLKPADRLFEKNGAGTQVPIHISGTREDPKFGVDFGHMKHTSPQVPGEPK
ncbi:MAG: AsmA-like C-terminal region-containing protein [Terracidiphilus sp.]